MKKPLRAYSNPNKSSCSLWVGIVFKYTKAELRRWIAPYQIKKMKILMNFKVSVQIIIIITVFILMPLKCIKFFEGYIDNRSFFHVEYKIEGNTCCKIPPKTRQKKTMYYVIKKDGKELPQLCELLINDKVLLTVKYTREDFKRINWEFIIPENIDTSKIYTEYPFR